MTNQPQPRPALDARRAADLKEQVGGLIANPVNGFGHTRAVDVLQSIPGYVAEFNQVNSDKVDIENPGLKRHRRPEETSWSP